MEAFKIRHVLRELCPLLVAAAALWFVPAGGAAQTPPAPTPPPTKTIEGVTFGPDTSRLNMTSDQQRVAFRNLRLLAPHNLVSRGASVSPLPQAPMDLKGFTYDYQHRTRSLEDFLTETRVAGLLVVKDGRVVAERYAHGHGPASVWVSFSVAKSVLSLLYGAALKDGSIRSLDDPVTRYLPQLRGSAYDDVSYATSCKCRPASRGSRTGRTRASTWRSSPAPGEPADSKRSSPT